MTTWTPRPEGLQQILHVLRNANSPDNAVQQQVHQQLDEFNKVPDFNNYLMFILTRASEEAESVRAVAGILLKNNVLFNKNKAPMSADVLNYLKESCLVSLGDPQALVRNTITSLTTTLVTNSGLLNWPSLLPSLLRNLESQDFNVVDGSFGALAKVLEDSGSDFRNEQLGQHNDMIAKKLIELSDSQHPKLRIHALTCYNFLIQYYVPAAFHHINDYINALSRRATDQVGDVRALVCRAFVHILDTSAEVLLPGLQNIADFMLFSANDENPTVALDACEFWLAFAEHELLKDHLEPFVARLISILMKQMVYSDYDIAVLGEEDDEEEQAAPDRDQDLKPRHYKAKNRAVNGNDSDSDEDEDEDEVYNEWNLRKCSAATLDVLSTAYGTSILEYLLPLLNQQLFSNDWKLKEAGVLAVGAIAEGCRDGVEPHLDKMSPLFFQFLTEKRPLLRSITCWTLSRYCSWFISQNPDTVFWPMLHGILDMVVNNNKRVQEAACSALATLEEEAGTTLIPYLKPILQAINVAFTKYHSRNLFILYDALGTLAENVGDAFCQPEFVQLIMPPLIHKWHELSNEDTGIFALLECMSSVASALGPAFMPYTEPVFERAIALIKKTAHEKELATRDPNAHDVPDTDFMIVALDLLSGVVQGVGKASVPFIQKEPDFFQLLFMGISDETDEVRQSSCALVGDMALTAFELLVPHLPQYLPVLIQQCQPRDENSISSSNNACWAIGEISLRYGKNMELYVPTLLQKLIPILNHADMSRTMRENAAITLGRLGITFPTFLAPHLGNFAYNWCKALIRTRENEEKESAFLGFCNIVQLNPTAVAPHIVSLYEAIANWERPSSAVVEAFRQLLHGFNNLLGPDQWNNVLAKFPADLNQRVSTVYHLK